MWIDSCRHVCSSKWNVLCSVLPLVSDIALNYLDDLFEDPEISSGSHAGTASWRRSGADCCPTATQATPKTKSIGVLSRHMECLLGAYGSGSLEGGVVGQGVGVSQVELCNV
jgi:hypothetical protein